MYRSFPTEAEARQFIKTNLRGAYTLFYDWSTCLWVVRYGTDGNR